ncbi:MAG: toll/interleukin-1 receptor domain-containing protein [Chloroflexi bacterium]|nr:toll/interleukin-1 receptor domain-containing protein [Chloroflexota bacterium]
MVLKKIFLSYAHQDVPLVEQLKKYLSPLEQDGSIYICDAYDINAGTEQEHETAQNLNSADIILLMVSPEFLDSDYCYSPEMRRAIERHERGEARVIPVILRPVYYQRTPFGRLQTLPTNGHPIVASNWKSLDDAFLDVAEGIRRAA